MKLAYVSRSDGVHDRRFVEGWVEAGFEVLSWQVADGVGALSEELASFAPDVVQVGPLTSPGDEVAAVWDGPLIATSWGFDLMDETLREPELASAAQRVLARANLVFVDNDAVSARARLLGADPASIVNFPWGLAGAWLNRPAERQHEGIVLLSTRRHEELYRVEDTVRAFVSLANEFSEVRLVLAGRGSTTGVLRAIVEDAGLTERVSIVGDLDQPELRSAYLSADIYISASGVDGTSISLLEAMACGLPVVVPRIAGNLQWVTERTGWLFEVGDVDDLEARLRALISDPLVRAEAARRAATALDQVHVGANWAVTVQRFPEFAERAIANHRLRAGVNS